MPGTRVWDQRDSFLISKQLTENDVGDLDEQPAENQVGERSLQHATLLEVLE